MRLRKLHHRNIILTLDLVQCLSILRLNVVLLSSETSHGSIVGRVIVAIILKRSCWLRGVSGWRRGSRGSALRLVRLFRCVGVVSRNLRTYVSGSRHRCSTAIARTHTTLGCRRSIEGLLCLTKLSVWVPVSKPLALEDISY